MLPGETICNLLVAVHNSCFHKSTSFHYVNNARQQYLFRCHKNCIYICITRARRAESDIKIGPFVEAVLTIFPGAKQHVYAKAL